MVAVAGPDIQSGCVTKRQCEPEIKKDRLCEKTYMKHKKSSILSTFVREKL